MPPDAFYTESVNELDAAGVFDGTECSDGFCPGDPIDRKTMAVWVVRLLDGEDPPPVAQSKFTDVEAGSFYSPFIERLAALGVTRGCGDGSGFCPDDAVNRAEMAVFLSRAYDLPDGPDPGFSDVASTAWYAADVARLAASGVTSGCGGTGFCPGKPTTRAQMATFLGRAEQRSDRMESAEQDDSEADPATTPPLGEVVSAGRWHSCGVRTDGTVTCWGSNEGITKQGHDETDPWVFVHDGKLDAPADKFVSVSAGDYYSCGVRIDQTVACWGNLAGGTDAPAGRYTMVAAGHAHACGVREDQTVICWGSNTHVADEETHIDVQDDRTVAVPGQFTMVGAGSLHSCGLRTDRTVVCWGDNAWGQTDAPAGQFRMISVGGHSTCGLRADQTVTCWGPPYTGAVSEGFEAPSGRFALVSTGFGHACGVRTDQTAVCWGFNQNFDLAADRLVENGAKRAPSGSFGRSLGRKQSFVWLADRSDRRLLGFERTFRP